MTQVSRWKLFLPIIDFRLKIMVVEFSFQVFTENIEADAVIYFNIYLRIWKWDATFLIYDTGLRKVLRRRPDR